MDNNPVPAQQQKQSPQQAVSGMAWKLNTLETKIRINEQNIINDRRHVQLLNANVLELKREFRQKIDSLMQERHDLSRRVNDLDSRVQALEKRLVKFVKRTEISALKKFHENFNYFDNEMTKEEADRILDSIVGQTEESKTKS